MRKMLRLNTVEFGTEVELKSVMSGVIHDAAIQDRRKQVWQPPTPLIRRE
jgi:hypothetical protein